MSAGLVKPSSGAYEKPLFAVEELVGEVIGSILSSDGESENINGRVDTVVTSFGCPRAFFECHILKDAVEGHSDQRSRVETQQEE
jgi:hypothetical protein